MFIKFRYAINSVVGLLNICAFRVHNDYTNHLFFQKSLMFIS